MKQVQQLKAHHQGEVVTLNRDTHFDTIGPDEKLYIVSHGSSTDGSLPFIGTDSLVSWLTGSDHGLPRKFGGIVMLSCYSGLGKGQGLTNSVDASLAERIADGSKDKVEPGTPVEGAKGYSFGSPEFGRTGHSSIMSLNLEPFYWVDDPQK
ncbi:MAG: hypothetical protein ACRDRV_07140 [Pseudonocardiaceae bacterium]